MSDLGRIEKARLIVEAALERKADSLRGMGDLASGPEGAQAPAQQDNSFNDVVARTTRNRGLLAAALVDSPAVLGPENLADELLVN